MDTASRTLPKIREHPWDWGTKNEYEEVTLREQPYLHGHYRNKYYKTEYDIYDPRYTAVRSSEWDAFRDPKKFWYTPYVYNRKKLSDQVEGIFNRGISLEVYSRTAPEWVGLSAALYIPMRHYEYAGALQLQHVVRYAMGCPIEQAATFTAFDKQGRAQWISLWGIEFPGTKTDTALEAGKRLWMDDESYRLIREYMEQLLITDDWAEVLFALHMAIEPLVSTLLYRDLNQLALSHGDIVLPELNLVSEEQVAWQDQWIQKFFEFIVLDPCMNRWDYLKVLGYENWPGDYRWGHTLTDPRETPEDPRTNAAIVQEWADHWLPKAMAAVLPLQNLFDRANVDFSVSDSVIRTWEQTIKPTMAKLGLTAQR